MRTRFQDTCLPVLITIGSLLGAAGCSPPEDAPDAATGQVSVLLTEGTNMAAAASPDGRTLVLGVQGALWTVPVAGGEARRITGPDAEATSPSWSPDGSRIAFQSYDASGFYNVWTIAPDGTDARALTSGGYDHREPAWSSDGTRIAFSSDRSGSGFYDVWTVEVRTGDYERLTEGDAHEIYPAWSPDGARVAFASDGSIRAVDATGQVEELATVAQGTALAPAWRRDGDGIAYLDGDRQVVLNGRAVTTGEDVFPFPVSFLPDGSFVYTADGRIRVRDASGGDVREIPFRATLTLDRPTGPNKDHRLDSPDPRPVQGIFAPALSPDGARVAFVALNDLWVMTIGERPEQLTDDMSVEWVPSWSPDGSELFFSSDRESPGYPDLYAMELDTRAVRRVSTTPDSRMIFPALSPDGRSFAYIDASSQTLRVHDIASGQSRIVAQQAGNIGARPSWSPDGRRIVLADFQRSNSRFREGRNLIRVVDVASGQATLVEPGTFPEALAERLEAGPSWSPDGRWLAYVMNATLHVLPVTPEGAPTGPPREVTGGTADMPTWSGDSQTILYVSNGRLRTVQLDGSGARDIPVDLTWQPTVPEEGTTIIHAGALWDGVREELQPNVEITLDGARISAVRPIEPGAAAAAQASGARFIDATGLTVMPGIWDTHVHSRVLDATATWWAVQLAYGLTSVISNGSSTYLTVLQKESLAAGRLTGPRLFAGALFDGPRTYYGHHRIIQDEATLALEIEKARDLDMDYLKAYVRAPAPFMRMIAQTANEMGVGSGSHLLSPGAQVGLGGSTHISSTQRMGYSWSEAGDSYQDAVALFSQAGYALSSSHSGNNVLGDDPDVLTDPRFTVLMPPQYGDQIRAQAGTAPTAQGRQAVQRAVAAPARFLNAGGLVTLGTDSPLSWPGLSLHTRLRAFATAVSNHEALQSVTINAARYARADHELGTVEPGKIADLLFVRGDPLADVANAANVERVMKNGIDHTLEEILSPFLPGPPRDR